MTVRVDHRDTEVVVVVTGDFDLRTAHEPYEAVSALFADGADVTHVVVDLTGVDFVDSTGLGGLVRLKHEADQRGVPVVLRGLGPRLRQLFEMTGLVHEFTLEPTPGAAGA